MVEVGEKTGLRSYRYDGVQRLLEVEFPRGARYHYFDVPLSVVEWLEVVPNKARYVNAIIARDYTYECVNDGRPKATENLEEALRLSLAIATGTPVRS